MCFKDLKKCAVGHKIKKSACSKIFCCIDGIKSKAIKTATATPTRKKVEYEDE